MKNTYVTPEVEVIASDAINVLAVSSVGDIEIGAGGIF